MAQDEADALARKLARDAKLLHAMEGLPDSHNVKTVLAAIFLGIDRKTLLRKRRGYTRKRPKDTKVGGKKGDAVDVPALEGFPQPVGVPKVAQNFDGTIGNNADLFWNMGDLRKWKALRRGGDDAFYKRNICDFASAWDVFNEEQPWITDADGSICDGLYGLSDDHFDKWLRVPGHLDQLVEADLRTVLIEMTWVNAEQRLVWHRQWIEMLAMVATVGEQESRAIQRDIELSEKIGDAHGKSC